MNPGGMLGQLRKEPSRVTHPTVTAQKTKSDTQMTHATREEYPEPPEQHDVSQSSTAEKTRTVACLQVLASFLINMNVYGLVNAFGVFQNYYETRYLASYSSSAISWIGTVQGALVLIIGALAGPIFDKGYFMITLKLSSAVLVFSWMMLSLSTKYYQIMLTQGFLAGICVGLLEIPSIALIPVYFKKRLGLALGLAIAGAPTGGLLYSLIFRAALDATNFGWATRIVGFVVLVTMGFAIIIIRPQDAERKSSARKFLDLSAFRDPAFICFLLAGFFTYCAALVPYFTTPAYALSLGASSHLATYLIAVLNSAQILGRIGPPALSDYIGGAYILLVALAAMGVMGLAWIGVTTLRGFVAFLVLFGFVSGAVATLPATVIPYICPSSENLGTRIGMIYAAAGVGTLIGNPVALATAGHALRRNEFLGAQLWMGLCALTGAGFFVLPARTAQKALTASRKQVTTQRENPPSG